MGMIFKNYTVTGHLGSGTVRVLYDTGSGSSFVRRSVAENLGNIVHTLLPMTFTMADGWGTLTVDQDVALYIDVDGTGLMHHFYVVDNLAEELIAGADLIRKWKISLDPDTQTVTVDPRAESLAYRTGIAIPVPASGE